MRGCLMNPVSSCISLGNLCCSLMGVKCIREKGTCIFCGSPQLYQPATSSPKKPFILILKFFYCGLFFFWVASKLVMHSDFKILATLDISNYRDWSSIKERNIDFLQNSSLDIQHTYSSEFSIDKSTFETPLFYGVKLFYYISLMSSISSNLLHLSTSNTPYNFSEFINTTGKGVLP